MENDQRKIRDPSSGVNQTGIRDHNERLVLSLIQRHGALASADLARRTGLSAQTVSVIIRALEADGLLDRGAPQRGKVGKPLTPVMLRPEGILGMGLKIGRRSTELVLMDVSGRIHQRIGTTYIYPLPDQILTFLRDGLAEILARMSPDARARLAGIGIGVPFQMWNWLDTVRASPAEMDAWRHVDFVTHVASFSDLPVLVWNDATAACAAEHLFGRGREFADYAYVFIGFFAGGGVVMNDAVYAGRTGNAGAFGSLPVRSTAERGHQLIQNASIYLLEERLAAAGRDPLAIWQARDDWAVFEPHLTDWIDHTARHLAVACASISAVIDFEAIVIDGAFPPHVRRRILDRTRLYLRDIDTQGLDLPRIEEGEAGAQARVIGAASLPISATYLLNRSALGG
jgi:predicted NBD/HSP70 family sugar kinase